MALRIKSTKTGMQLMNGKIDTTRWPKVPTHIKDGEYKGIAEGWYGVLVGTDGLEYFKDGSIRYETFKECELCCSVHNEWLGMSRINVARLYNQRRMSQVNAPLDY